MIPPVDINDVKLSVKVKNDKLRDEFAKEIVQGLIKSNVELTPKEIAEKSYLIAEEMLKARESRI